jgi:hypothetical protein
MTGGYFNLIQCRGLIYQTRIWKTFINKGFSVSSLEDDLKVFIDIQLFHKIKQDNGGIKQITGLKKEYPKIYKATKFAFKSLKGKGGKSGLRLIYAHFEKEDIIEFIEMYYKGDQENEDSDRIKE